MDPLPIPALDYEEHTWSAESDGMSSRAKIAAASGPYRSAVVPEIAEYEPRLPADLAADAEEATAALSRFDSYARSVLGVESPTLGPMSAILLRTESTSSSQIENLTVGARQLALAEIDQSTSGNAQLVVANVRAMEAALELAHRLDERAVLTMHAELLHAEPGWSRRAGRYRDGLVWVGTSSITPRGASYVAPQPAQVPAAMADLVRFMSREDLPVLVQAAIAHAQFETIHPFTDGNGRVGRALIHTVLTRRGLATEAILPVRLVLSTLREEYVAGLTVFRHDQPVGTTGSRAAHAAWLRVFASAVLIASEQAGRLATELAELRVDWEELPAVLDVEDAIKPGAPVVNEVYPGNLFIYHGKYDHQKLRFGDVEATLRASMNRTDSLSAPGLAPRSGTSSGSRSWGVTSAGAVVSFSA